MQVKKGLYSLAEARRLAYETDQENKRLKEENITTPEFIDQETLKALDELKVRFIKQFLREELTNGE
jgi:predicted nucleic acid-binding protein